jgi:hypothetical protein
MTLYGGRIVLSDRERLRIDVITHAAEVVATCRQLAAQEPSGIGRAKYAQIAEYAELVFEQMKIHDRLAPAFAGRLD